MSLSALLSIPAVAPPVATAALVSDSAANSAAISAASSTASSAATSTAATTASVSSNTIATAGSSSLQAVTKDLVALLKALASGNVSESKASLARLQADIRTQQSASATAATASEQPPFNVVLNRVAETLAAADTGKALQELATYLIQGGQASGNIVDERA